MFSNGVGNVFSNEVGNKSLMGWSMCLYGVVNVSVMEQRISI